ncbi:unnamed protein product [Phytomonas sp. Hart1]|nr:unnamed protein product [Phytomonas sp. Hart1]|eukprot:CCW70136.1 unnamed protein product [Phytomonas sp. isolate Hart1]
MFWGEHALYLCALLPISLTGDWVGGKVGEALERLFPSSDEDLRQNARERQAEADYAADLQSYLRRMAEEAVGAEAPPAGKPHNHRPQANPPPPEEGEPTRPPFEGSERRVHNGRSGSQDFYAILGVEANATEQEIKKAYHKLALKYHPDRVGKDSPEAHHAARERMARINDAYDTLGDHRKRMEYNNTRTMMPMFEYMDKLETMSGLQLIGIGIGIISLMGTMLYMQLRSAFYSITSPGCVPLYFHQNLQGF